MIPYRKTAYRVWHIESRTMIYEVYAEYGANRKEVESKAFEKAFELLEIEL